MRAGRRALWVAALIAFCAAPLSVAPWPGETSASAALSRAPSCAAGQVRISESPGVPGMGHFSDLIQVTNTGGRACDLQGFPTVGLLNSAGVQVATAVQNDAALGGPTNQAPVRLGVGEAATAQLAGTDMPLGTATSCPTYASYTVSLPESGGSTVFEGPLADCSGLYTTSFVPGFNGFSASGEVAGTAPACSRRATSTGAPGAVVVVNAWSGRRLASSTAVVPGPHSSQPYRLIVAPGRYRISATRASSREVIVRAGRIDDLGRYGGCASPGTTSTIPGAGGGATTSTTARAASTSGRVVPAVTFSTHDALDQFTPQTKSTWWAVVGDDATSKSVVVRTVDSGGRWQNVTPPVSQAQLGYFSTDFLNGDIGWAIAVPLSQSTSANADPIYRTLDGGMSWEHLGTVPGACQLDFVDRAHGWCTLLGGAAGSESVRMYRTLDGGETWDLVSQTAVPPATSTPAALLFGCDKGITFTSPAVGWDTGACNGGIAYVSTSDDGGSHWRQLPQLPVPPGVSTSGGWDMGPPTVVGNEIAVAVSFDGSSGVSAVATSADGGQTWRTRVVPGLRPPAIVDLIDPTHWIGTDGMMLVATSDGGTQWKRWKPAVGMRDASGTPLMLDFLSPTLGWAVSRDAGGPLWWTTDGGRTWMPITVATTP
jgi:hypothetical protein